MDPITELQTRVDWIVTATIDTVQLLASEGGPDVGKIAECVAFVQKEVATVAGALDSVPAMAESSSALYERLSALHAEEAELDRQLAALRPAAEAALVVARAHADRVSTTLFEAHLEQQRHVGDEDNAAAPRMPAS